MKPSKHKMTVLSQIFKLIPRNLIPKLANEFGIDRQSRVFSPTSHVLALVFGQLTHALGLNDICDTLRNHCGLVAILFSFAATCKANGVNYRQWLEDILIRINTTPASQIDSLLPQNWDLQPTLKYPGKATQTRL